jgi:hypothetical protein
MTIFTRDGLIDMLRHNVVSVTFTKVNGEERVMKCTLRSDLVPNALIQNGELVLEQKQSSNNVSVWDVDANGWRSFRVANVKNISVG